MERFDFSSGEYTFEKVLALIQENAKSFRETKDLLKEKSLETERKFEESDRKFQETKELLKESSLETERIIKESSLETERKFEESDRKFQETKELLKEKSLEADRRLKEIGKQIGGLGNKFGSFTEGLFTPSVNKLLKDKFNCKKSLKNYKFSDNGNSFEIDVLGVSSCACYLTEIKSKLTDDAITQLQNIISQMNSFDDDYRNKPKYGVIVAINYNEETMIKVLKAG